MSLHITCSGRKNSVLSALQTQVVQSKTFKQNTNKNGNKWKTEARMLGKSVTEDSQEPQNVNVSPLCFCPAADAVVISVPLGVLKKEIIAFQPPLPQRKQTAIRQLGFGVLNKVCARPASHFPQLQS